MDTFFSGFEGKKSELIPILQRIQQKHGYLPHDKLLRAARFLDMPVSAVFGVATFYAQFHLTRQGKHKIRVCQGTACHVKGGKRIMNAVEKQLHIKQGETTPDYAFTLERVACLGSCALAPVMVIDDRVHGQTTALDIKKLIAALHDAPSRRCHRRKVPARATKQRAGNGRQ